MRSSEIANNVNAGILSGAKVTAILVLASLTVTTSAVQLSRLMMSRTDKRLTNDSGVDRGDMSSQHREKHPTRGKGRPHLASVCVLASNKKPPS